MVKPMNPLGPPGTWPGLPLGNPWAERQQKPFFMHEELDNRKNQSPFV
jgi:hypothetical protein